MALVFINFKFHDGAWGGGNAALKLLSNHLRATSQLAITPDKADVIIVNSHHMLCEAKRIINSNPHIKVIHRIDGPMGLQRGSIINLKDDIEVYKFNQEYADYTIFQSSYSQKANLAFGLSLLDIDKSSVVPNIADPSIFYPPNSAYAGNKIRIISAIWSDNENKGYQILEHLDKNLDFDKYEVMLVSRMTKQFNNIKHINVLPPKVLADIAFVFYF